MTDLVVAPQRSTVVGANEWTLMSKQAEYLATSDIIPAAYRRKPANIVVAALTGRTHGWDVLTAMRNGHVIEGVWGMKPEAMLGLVLAAGHRVDIERVDWGDVLERGARVTAHREGQQPVTVMYLVEHAVNEGLVNLKDGKPFARSSSGKKLPWELYPVDMCQWRAVGRALRARYPDITLGIYTTDELGVSLADSGEVVDAEVIERPPAEPTLLSQEAIAKFVTSCETEGLDPSGVMRRAFPDRPLDDPLTDYDLPRLRDVFRQMVEEAVELRNHGGTEPYQDTVPPPPDEVRPASRNQVGKIKGEYERLGLEDRDEQLRYSGAVVGHDVATHNDLTRDEAATLIEYLVGTEFLE